MRTLDIEAVTKPNGAGFTFNMPIKYLRLRISDVRVNGWPARINRVSDEYPDALTVKVYATFIPQEPIYAML